MSARCYRTSDMFHGWMLVKHLWRNWVVLQAFLVALGMVMEN